MNFRCNKVSKEIKKVLSLNILNFSTLVTIIDVKVSPNLREASVFFSIFGPEELCQKTLQQLKANSSSLQYIVENL